MTCVYSLRRGASVCDENHYLRPLMISALKSEELSQMLFALCANKSVSNEEVGLEVCYL